MGHGGITFEIDFRPQVNTDNLSDDERMGMCKKASREVKRKEGIYVKTMEKGKIGMKKSYALNMPEKLSKKGKARRVELTDAFACPTQPTLYLQVHENKDKQQVVTVIVPTSEARISKVLPHEIQYELKLVADISEGK